MAASVKNDWLGYLDRSYEQIKTSVLARLGISNPEMSDHSESNPLIIFLGMFSGIAEMLGYYTDNMAEESFLATAQRTSSVIRRSQGLDYRIKARAPEMTEIKIVWSMSVPSTFVIPAGALIVSSKESLTFQTLETIVILIGSTISYLPMAQVEILENAALTLTNGTPNQKINIGTNYMHRTMELIIGVDAYNEVETWAGVLPTDKSYLVEIFEDGNAYIVLGDNINGLIPPNSTPVSVKYFTTLGGDGKVGAGGFDQNTIDLGIALPGALSINSANSAAQSAGGSDYEDIEKIRKNAPRSLRTLERMVTRPDHKAVMEMVSGVSKADIQFNCGKRVYIYIAPEGGGIAGSLLLGRAQARADETKVVGTFPVTRPAGETHLVLGINVTAKRRKSQQGTYDQVMAALIAFGSIERQDINGSIRLSDIYGLVDNLPNVEYMDLTKMYTKPYARPINHNNPLIWTSTTTTQSFVQTKWRLEYDGTSIRVVKNGNYLITIPIGTEYNDEQISGVKFTISAGGYSSGNQWEFTTYPYGRNLTLDDFTVFTIVEEDVSLIVSELPSTNI